VGKKRKRSPTKVGETPSKKKQTRVPSFEPPPAEVPDSQGAVPAQNHKANEPPNAQELAPSPRQGSKQSSPAGDEEALPRTGEAEDSMEMDGSDNQEIHSQLALESEAQRLVAEEAAGPGPDATDDGPIMGDEAVDMNKEWQAQESDGTALRTGVAAEQVRRTRMEEVLAMLRGSLEALRSAALSRDEVYQVEDMCMDIKRELYEAERRGRK